MPAQHCLVTGLVQGVAFRWFVRETAQRLGLVGWVQNLPDGRVEAVLQGDAAALALAREALSIGPSRARVTNLACSDIPEAPSLRGFRILR
ncbi:acylphosphatase [Megalodesulfovibrio paquesii]